MNKKINIIIIGLILLSTIVAGFFLYFENFNGGNNSLTNTISFKEGKSDLSTNSIFNGGCQEAYEKVLALNEFDFSVCKESDIRGGSFSSDATGEIRNNLVIIFDASGSMAQTVSGRLKIDIAKEATKKYIDSLGSDKLLNLSLIVYGHKGGNSQSQKAVSCAGIEEIYYLGPVNTEVAKKKIDQLRPTGWTPIAKSLQMAGEILRKNPVNGKQIILLVSDGKETCDGNPVEMIKDLRNSGLNVTANVIGFDVGGADEEELRNIAQSGGGDYFSVKNAQDFAMVFQKHENVLKRVDYMVGRTIEKLYDVSNVFNQYNQCRVMLKKEETVMMLDIHVSKLAGEKCESYADAEYQKRYLEIEQKIESNFKNDKKKFEALKFK